jgi:dTDP-4-dehydrorhamnose reductase
MKILVTGSNGLLGQKLTSLIVKGRVHELVATGRGRSVNQPEAVRYLEMDITDRASVQRIIASVRPDVIIHAAAMTQVDDCQLNQDLCWKINVEGTANLVDAAHVVACHLIYVSTDFIFDGNEGPLTEEAIPAPVNFYGESKLAAEKLVMAYPGKWTIIRTVLVYGATSEKSRSNIVLWVKQSLEAGKTIHVVDDQLRTPTLAEDLAQGCLLAAEQGAAGIFNISGSALLTPYQIALQTADFFGLDKTKVVRTDSAQFKQPALRPIRTGFIIDKARKMLGYIPHSFSAGLQIIKEQLTQYGS